MNPLKVAAGFMAVIYSSRKVLGVLQNTYIFFCFIFHLVQPKQSVQTCKILKHCFDPSALHCQPWCTVWTFHFTCAFGLSALYGCECFEGYYRFKPSPFWAVDEN